MFPEEPIFLFFMKAKLKRRKIAGENVLKPQLPNEMKITEERGRIRKIEEVNTVWQKILCAKWRLPRRQLSSSLNTRARPIISVAQAAKQRLTRTLPSTLSNFGKESNLCTYLSFFEKGLNWRSKKQRALLREYSRSERKPKI